MKRQKRFIILTVGMLLWTDNWTTKEAFWRRGDNVFKNRTMRTYTEILIWVLNSNDFNFYENVYYYENSVDFLENKVKIHYITTVYEFQ